MAVPASASFRCLNALRYFVRSYVTSPTIIRAMTEIPANTPSPIGRTDRCFPGRLNEDSGVVVTPAAEDATFIPVAAALEPLPALAPATAGDGSAADVDWVDADVTVCDTDPEGIMPRVVIGMAAPEGSVLEDMVKLLLILFDEVTALEEESVVREGTAVDGDADVVEDEVVDGEEISADGSALAVDEEAPVVLGDADGAWLFPREPPLASVVSVHDVTSWTAELPLASVIGVRMTVHI